MSCAGLSPAIGNDSASGDNDAATLPLSPRTCTSSPPPPCCRCFAGPCSCTADHSRASAGGAWDAWLLDELADRWQPDQYDSAHADASRCPAAVRPRAHAHNSTSCTSALPLRLTRPISDVLVDLKVTPAHSRSHSAPPLCGIHDMDKAASVAATSVCDVVDNRRRGSADIREVRTHGALSSTRGTQVKPVELSPDHSKHGSRPQPSLADLATLVRSDKDHSRSCSTVQLDLYAAQVAAARTARLIHLAQVVECTFADCLRAEDKTNFVRLYNAFQDALADVATVPDLSPPLRADQLTYPLSFVDTLPASSQRELIEFLTKVKSDSNFLGDRLASLSHREILALLPERIASRNSDSVFGSSQRPASRHSLHAEVAVDVPLTLLSNLCYASPLEALILSVRSPSLDSLMDDAVATDVWASVCARRIAEHRHDGAKLVPAVVDIWASCSTWRGKAELELWILQTLQEGAFLLERPPLPTFIMHVEGRQHHRPEDEIRREDFYTRATNSLLDLLADNSGPSVIPDGAVHMCQAIQTKLNSTATPGFVATRWLVASFLPDALMLPEMHGMAADHFISEPSRDRIFSQIVSRVQRAVLDAVDPWRRNGKPLSETAERAKAILDRLCVPRNSKMDQSVGQSPGASPASARPNKKPSVSAVVGLSSADITCLVNALYPHRREHTISERDSTRSGLLSSASSVSGLSLFRNAATSEGDGNSLKFLPLESTDATTEHQADARVADTAESIGNREPVSHNEQEEQTMRDVCAAIDDVLTTTSRPRPSDWVMLIDDGKKLLRTVHDDLSAGLDSLKSAARTVNLEPIDFRPCRAAVKALLSSQSKHQSYHEVRQRERQGDADQWGSIISALENRMLDAEQRRDFLSSHFWYQHLQTIRSFGPKGKPSNGLKTVLDDLAAGVRRSLQYSEALTQRCNHRLDLIRPVLDGNLTELAHMTGLMRKQRNKVWYAVDVRVSTAGDEARSIASVLRLMGKPETPGTVRSSPSLRHSNTGKAYHRKTEAQILEILSAPSNHGGPNKLSDDQTRALNNWFKNTGIDIICRGEERLHKLCMEVRKCIDTVMDGHAGRGVAAVWSWDDPLFAGDAAQLFEPSRKASVGRSPLPAHFVQRSGIPQKRSTGSVSAMSSMSQPLSSHSSRDLLESRSSAPTNRSSAPGWSGTETDLQSLSSVTSVVGSMRTGPSPAWRITNRSGTATSESAARREFVELLREHMTSLLLSEIGTTVFFDGSETDCSFWRGLGGELTQAHLRTMLRSSSATTAKKASSKRFNFEKAFRSLVREFSVSASPHTKLAHLHSIDTLLERQSEARRSRRDSSAGGSPDPPLPIRTTDVKVERFRQLFCDPLTRPQYIFRDLQFIAALVPASTLDGTVEGKSFWNAAVAAAILKQDARQVMVIKADNIVSYHTNNRGPGRTPSSAQQQRRDTAAFTPSSSPPPGDGSTEPEDVSRYSMADAATLMQIAAKEGDAAAQRELATLYLTHPELLVPRVAPLTLPRDVFRPELEATWRKNQHPSRHDPGAMCAALHWMTLSAKGGDALAGEFLRQREEIDRLP